LETGNYSGAALNGVKFLADIGLMFVKANPVGILLSIGYGISDAYTFDN